MKPYQHYQAIGLPWLAETPNHWEVDRIGRHFSERKTKVSDKDYTPLSVGKKGVLPQLENVAVTKNGDNRKLVKTGDYVFNSRSDRRGSSGISDYEGSVSVIYTVLTPHGFSEKWCHHLFRSHAFIEEFYRNGRGIVDDLWTTRFSETRGIFIPIPPREEQDQIVRFLDWKVTEVNHFIREKRRQIRRLVELKQSIIYRAVTFGLRSDVPMKKSELSPWVEKLPTTWDEVKIKRILTKLNRICSSEDEILICSNKGTVFPRGESRLGLISSKEDVYQGVSEGDLLIHGMDTWHGAIAISGYSGKCTTVVHVCDSTQDKRFVSYYLRMLAFRKLYKAITNGVRQNTSDFRSWGKAGDIVIALPPLEEQHAIADYIDARCEEIDAMIAAIKSEIELITEYRTRMISDVVTGKVDVRDVVIPESVEEEPAADEEDIEEEETLDEEVEENVDD